MKNIGCFENMYERIINGEELTTKLLKECGFDSKDLTELVKEDILERIKRGFYKLKKVENNKETGLYFYAKKLISKSEYDKAMVCFEKCYEVDQNHNGTNFQLFKRNIELKKYQEALFYLNKVKESNNYQTDYNLYVFLLSYLIDVPENLKEIVKNITLKDILVDKKDLRYTGYYDKINAIREEIFNGKFSLASKLYIELIKERKINKPVDLLSRTLLSQAMIVLNNRKKELIKLTERKDYLVIKNFLENILLNKQLSNDEKLILKIVDAILIAQNLDEIPEKQKIESSKLDVVLENFEYERAFGMYNLYCEKYQIDKTKDIKFKLLNDLKNIVIDKKNETVEYIDMVNYILNSDIKTVVEKLRIFLKSIKKENYEFLIINHIKLSLLENDNFSKPLAILVCLGSNNYEFNLLDYINKFYLALTDGYIKDAELYLEIIKQSKNIGQNCVYVKELEEIYENTKDAVKKYNEQNNKGNLESQEFVEEEIEYLPPKVVDKKEEIYSIEQIEEIIRQKREKLIEQGGVVMLPPMSEKEIKEYKNEIFRHKDLKCFVIGEGRNTRVVIRYNPFLENFDLKGTLLSIKEAEKEYNFKKAIELQLLTLQFGNPKAISYGKLGYLYERAHKDDKAIMYYTIATELSKNEEKQLDYTQRIEYLKGSIEKEEIKPSVKMDSSSFLNDIDNYYGIDNFEELNEEIIAGNLDVETFCLQHGYTYEETNLIKLIYAKLYYYKGFYYLGDKFLESVKTKDENIKRIKAEINRNRNYYINRMHETDLSFVRRLKP